MSGLNSSYHHYPHFRVLQKGPNIKKLFVRAAGRPYSLLKHSALYGNVVKEGPYSKRRVWCLSFNILHRC